jgi:hypothetical protein
MLDGLDDPFSPARCLTFLTVLGATWTCVLSVTLRAITWEGSDGCFSISSKRTSKTSPFILRGPLGPLFFTPGPL